MPSNCAGGQVSKLNLDTQGPPSKPKRRAPKPATPRRPARPAAPTCRSTRKSRSPRTARKFVDSPEPTTVDVGIPWDPTAPIANSYLKVAKVTLPEGMGINPSAEQRPRHRAPTHSSTTTPTSRWNARRPRRSARSRCRRPSLPANSINGDVYVGAPLKNGPGAFESGEQFRIFIYAFSTRYGVNVRLEGKVTPNPTTGQLTAVVAENPQATFRNFRLHFIGGDKGILTSPPTCGPNTTTTEFTPWSENPDHNKPTTNTALASVPGGGTCPTTLGDPQVRAELHGRNRNRPRRPSTARSASYIGRTDGSAGAESRQRDPAEGPRRATGRDPLLRGSRTRRRGGKQRHRRSWRNPAAPSKARSAR